MFNEFSAAAFRFGHSMIQPEMVLMSEAELEAVSAEVAQGRSIHAAAAGMQLRKISLRDHFHNPDTIKREPGLVEELARGLLTMPVGGVDEVFTAEVTNHLFERRRQKFSGLDLVALNIQRGRDHGLPGYNVYRELCGLQPLASWGQREADISAGALARMARLYRHPDDVDLFTGLVSERRTEAALVGPTLACLLAAQFAQLRQVCEVFIYVEYCLIWKCQCDRFWYETSDPLLRFSPRQLEAIRGVTLSSLVCQAGHSLGRVPEAAFDLPAAASNPLVPCRDLPALDLGPWREQQQCGAVSPCAGCSCTAAGDVCGASCSDLIRMFGVRAVQEDSQCRDKCLIVL